jgi:hypothetical protein
MAWVTMGIRVFLFVYFTADYLGLILPHMCSELPAGKGLRVS